MIVSSKLSGQRWGEALINSVFFCAKCYNRLGMFSYLIEKASLHAAYLALLSIMWLPLMATFSSLPTTLELPMIADFDPKVLDCGSSRTVN